MKKNNAYSTPIFAFVILWIAVTFILIILPVKSRFSNMLEITFVNAVFVFVVAVTALFWIQNVPRIRLFPVKLRNMNIRKLKFIWWFSLWSSGIGLFLIIYDRIFVRGINYSLGVRNARYQWLELGDIGSIYSKIGNLMVPFSYCILFLSVFHWEILEHKKRIIGICAGIGAQVGFAVINGGRSNILIAVVFLAVCCFIRQGRGKTFFPPIRMKFILGIGAGYFILQYCISIFYAFSGNTILYLRQTVFYLGASIEDWYYDYVNPLVNTLINIFVYLFHGSFYTGAVLENMPEDVSIDQNISLRGVWSILDRLNIIDYQMELPYFDSGSGAFVAVPGILLYDYGYAGFVIASLLFGILLGIILKEINSARGQLGIIKLAFSFIVLMHIFLSPVTMALGIGYFTFMIFALVSMEIISGTIYGFSNWTNVNISKGENNEGI